MLTGYYHVRCEADLRHVCGCWCGVLGYVALRVVLATCRMRSRVILVSRRVCASGVSRLVTKKFRSGKSHDRIFGRAQCVEARTKKRYVISLVL